MVKKEPLNSESEKKTYQIHSAKEIPWKYVKKAKRIVIKIGTRALIDENRDFDPVLFDTLSEDLTKLFQEGKELLLVSSGAVNAGVKILGLPDRPRDLLKQQVLAAIGNPILLAEYQKYFTFCKIGQVLVTQEDFSNRISYHNLQNTINEMLRMHIIPIFNENDVISVNELQTDNTEYNFTDNDILAGLVAASMNADLLIILSDVEGLYTKHPNSPYAEFIPYIPEITEEVFRMGKSGSKFGKGGMISKIVAANITTKAGGAVIIAHAKKTRIKEIMQGNCKLTFFCPAEKLPNKQLWLIFGANMKGKLFVDNGAKDAILHGASLLFQGIQDYQGDFKENDVVGIFSPTDEKTETDKAGYELFARGLVNYSHEELERFAHLPLDLRKQYFQQNCIREIVSHEHMAFS
jgi:glutamate 5-kinase